MTPRENHSKPDADIFISVDGQSFPVSEKHMNAGAILALAGLDPATYNLAKRHGNGEPYRDDQQVTVHNGDAFVSLRQSASVA